MFWRISNVIGVIGAIIVFIFIFALSENFLNPTNLPLVNVAEIVSNLAWVIGGALLIVLAFHKTQKLKSQQSYEMSDTEEKESLIKNRNLFLGSILIFFFITSVGSWIVNDYSVGLTLINVSVIFDLVFNLALLYLAVELIKDKKNVSKLLLYTLLAYSVGMVVSKVLRGEWNSLVVEPLLLAYFGFAILAPITRKNYRLAHYVLLPVVFAALVIVPSSSGLRLKNLTEAELLSEQQFTDLSNRLSGQYAIFLQKEKPNRAEIMDVIDTNELRNSKLEELDKKISEINAAHGELWPSPETMREMERLKYVKRFLEIHKQQGDKIKETMEFALTLGWDNQTNEQQDKLRKLKNEVEHYIEELTKVEFELFQSKVVPSQ